MVYNNIHYTKVFCDTYFWTTETRILATYFYYLHYL